MDKYSDLKNKSLEDIKNMSFEDLKQIKHNMDAYVQTAKNNNDKESLEKLEYITSMPEPTSSTSEVSVKPGNPTAESSNPTSNDGSSALPNKTQESKPSFEITSFFSQDLVDIKDIGNVSTKLLSDIRLNNTVLESVKYTKANNGFLVTWENEFKRSISQKQYINTSKIVEKQKLLTWIQNDYPCRMVLLDETTGSNLNVGNIQENTTGKGEELTSSKVEIDKNFLNPAVLSQNISTQMNYQKLNYNGVSLLHKLIAIEKTKNLVSCSDGISVNKRKLFSVKPNIVAIDQKTFLEMTKTGAMVKKQNNLIMNGFGENLLPSVIMAHFMQHDVQDDIVFYNDKYKSKWLSIDYTNVAISEPIYILTSDIVGFNNIVNNYTIDNFISSGIISQTKEYYFKYLGGDNAVKQYNEIYRTFEFGYQFDEVLLPKISMPNVIGFWVYSYDTNLLIKSSFDTDVDCVNMTLMFNKQLNDITRQLFHGRYSASLFSDYDIELEAQQNAFEIVKSQIKKYFKDKSTYLSSNWFLDLYINNYINDKLDNELGVNLAFGDHYYEDSIIKGDFLQETLLNYSESQDYLGFNNGIKTISIVEDRDYGVASTKWHDHLIFANLYDFNNPYGSKMQSKSLDFLYTNRTFYTFRTQGDADVIQNGDIGIEIKYVKSVINMSSQKPSKFKYTWLSDTLNNYLLQEGQERFAKDEELRYYNEQQSKLKTKPTVPEVLNDTGRVVDVEAETIDEDNQIVKVDTQMTKVENVLSKEEITKSNIQVFDDKSLSKDKIDKLFDTVKFNLLEIEKPKEQIDLKPMIEYQPKTGFFSDKYNISTSLLLTGTETKNGYSKITSFGRDKTITSYRTYIDNIGNLQLTDNAIQQLKAKRFDADWPKFKTALWCFAKTGYVREFKGKIKYLCERIAQYLFAYEEIDVNNLILLIENLNGEKDLTLADRLFLKICYNLLKIVLE